MNRTIIAVPGLLGIVSGATFLPSAVDPPGQIHRRPAIMTTLTQPKIEFEQPARGWVQTNCRFGMPELAEDHPYGPTWIVPHEGYVLQLSTVDKIPLWVSEKVTEAQISGDRPRRDLFRFDPTVPEHLQAGKPDYVRTGYDRGHQAPAGDQTSNQRLKDDTFFLTNMSSHKPRLNRSIWRFLEEWARDQITATAPVYIITGPIFYDSLEENPQTADGLVEYYSIGPGGVSVPTHFYKIVLQANGGRWRAIAFVLENRSHSRGERFEDFRRSIDWIEARTAIDFFPEMDDAIEDALESEIAAMWDQ
ncbi:MAG: DNA/RNA non-specific endonuclease [Planctomycetes bacterium]|nr:DNA/RNA non-specific endonuclease [Planctomycetota bacterium]